MKKVWMSILSFALILFMGISVGCSTTNKVVYKVEKYGTYADISVTRSGDNYVVKSFSEEANDLVTEGVSLIIRATSGTADDYTITAGSNSSKTGRFLVISFNGSEVSVSIVCNVTDEKTNDPVLESASFKITYEKFVEQA